MILKLLVTHTTPKNKNQLHLISLIMILLINKLAVIIIYDNLKRTIRIIKIYYITLINNVG